MWYRWCLVACGDLAPRRARAFSSNYRSRILVSKIGFEYQFRKSRRIDRWEKHLNASLPLKPEWLPAKYLRVAVFGVVFVIGGTAGTYYLIGARWKKIAAEEVADLAEQVLAQRALKATVLATLDELAQDPETLDAPDPPDAGSDRPRNQQGDRGAPVGGDPRRTGATGHGQLREPVAVL